MVAVISDASDGVTTASSGVTTASSGAQTARELHCVKCACRIQPRQLYVPNGLSRIGGMLILGPVHVACPTEHDIAHAKRMGRPL
jgi:X-X-X-Leu-X-X-Gly heptad repeat protein